MWATVDVGIDGITLPDHHYADFDAPRLDSESGGLTILDIVQGAKRYGGRLSQRAKPFSSAIR